MPRGRRSDGPDAVELAAGYGLVPDPWQELVVSDWLKVGRDDRWAAQRCGLAVPRQNGKNGVLEVRELFGMVILGERFLHTAHEVKTARKAFMRLASFFENEREYPELYEMVAEIRKTNGQEAIVLTNGGSCEFIARSKSSGRGFTVDVLVMDEAQELVDDALEALLPTISAGPRGNPQTIYTGTPPGPNANGDVWLRLRRDGVEGSDPALAWAEWSIEPADPRLSEAQVAAYLDDASNLARTNPALGRRLQVDVAASERAQMTAEGYGRERLGIWREDGINAKIPRKSWAALCDPASSISGRLVLAVAMPYDQLSAVIAVCGERADGLEHVEIIEARRGSAWVPARLKQLVAAHEADAVWIDKSGPASVLVSDIEAAGVKLEGLTLRDYAQACGAFFAAVVGTADDEPTVRHCGAAALDEAVKGATVRTIGDLWAWSRRDPTQDVSPLEAVTIARHGLVSAPPEPDVDLFFIDL